MKRFLFLILIYVSLISKGQEYIPILKDSNIWNYIHLCEGYCSDILKLLGDTIYAENEYKIIGSEYHQPNDLYPYYGFIREDTIEQKIYFLPNAYYEQVERLIYDFNLIDGDSLSLYYYYYQKDTIFIVDSVRTFNTSIDSRRIYYLSGPNNQWGSSEKPVWVEGIGSLNHILHSTYGYDYYFGLSCFYTDDSLIYQSPLSIEVGSCIYNTSSIEENYSSSFKIYPNPFIDHLIVQGENISDFLIIDVFDIKGYKVFENKYVDRGNISLTISLNNLFDGLYFLRIKSNKSVEIIKLRKLTAYH